MQRSNRSCINPYFCPEISGFRIPVLISNNHNMYKTNLIFSFISLGILSILVTGCGKEQTSAVNTSPRQGKLFEMVNVDHSGIRFNNEIIENEQFHYLNYDGIYQGSGVAVGDLNNDGRPDIYFAGNMAADKLYINKGDFKFEDITDKAGIRADDGWSTGVTLADVNADGWLDIYVCKFLIPDPQKLKNHLYINNGDQTFTESAEQYGLADGGFSMHANFFDYNRDGWLDVIVCNQPPNFRAHKAQADATRDLRYTNRLYRNNGNNTFTDVTNEAQIAGFSYTLSATVTDINEDGWPDIYIANDYYEPDRFFLNNRNGTFRNVADFALRHMSNFSMGADIADFNNDGLMDIYVADMVAEDNFRSKTNMGGMNPDQFWSIVENGGHHQYMFNTLQMNNSNGFFSEIAQMAGVSQTDWSWAPLFVDFDLDGWKDLYVSNGLLKDVRNKDYHIKYEQMLEEKKKEAQSEQVTIDPMEVLEMIPSQKIKNYMYRNQGDLTFANYTDDWGLDQPSFSQGAAYGDFDGDGDIDLVVNNMNDYAFLYKNLAVENRVGNYLNVKLIGTDRDRASMGARVEIEVNGQKQLQEVSPVRGYMSTSENILHFGLGSSDKISKLTAKWLDGRTIELQDVKVNQVLTLKYDDGAIQQPKQETANTLFESITQGSGVDFRHVESQFNDYAVEVLLPYRMSQLGPALGVGDCNGDGLEDIYAGGAAGQSGVLYLQQPGGFFQRATRQPWESDRSQEDAGALFFDADGDGDNDLLVTSGSNEFAEDSPLFQDRLYLNDGGGNFSRDPNGLPKMYTSSGKAAAADYDMDGDLDLFISGRQVPLHYGHPVNSYLLKNNGGKFSDATEESAKDLISLGMATDGKWVDYDADGDMDLVVVGEWMPITFLENKDGILTNKTSDMGMDNTTGWWNCIEMADMDGDGDMDFVIGNLGLNIKHKASEEEPFRCFIKDFDGNGSNDVYLGYYDKDGVCYPVRGRQCSSEQMPFIKKKFATYEDFATADINKVLEGKMDNAISLEARVFESVYIENQGNGQFRVVKLPHAAQVSPSYGIALGDWNRDGAMDIFTAGNFYQREVETTRSDAGIGCVLLGDGKGGFTPVHPRETGIQAILDVRDVKMINRSGSPYIVLANNNDNIHVYRLKQQTGTVQ